MVSNKRNNYIMTLGEKSLSQSQWGEFLGLGSSVINKRLKSGWSEERALTTPLIGAPVILSWKGKTMNMRQWSKFLKIPYGTIVDRLKVQGLCLDKVFKK
jgi:hypothetical protein